jgi:hypothetical protein
MSIDEQKTTSEKQNISCSADVDVKITKLPPGRIRKSLHFDYKKPIPLSKTFTNATAFSRVRFCQQEHDDGDSLNPIERIENLAYQFARKQGSESAQAQAEREETARRAELAAGKISITPLLADAPKSCAACGEIVAGDAKRHLILRAEQPSAGTLVTEVSLIAVYCDACGREPEATPESQTTNGWQVRLDTQERRVYDLSQTGLTYENIGGKIGKSAATVSRIMGRVDGKRKAWVQEQYAKTGGA